MPWASKEEVPGHLSSLNLAAANKWGEVYDALVREGKSEESAAKIAWHTVRAMRKAEAQAALFRAENRPIPKHADLPATKQPQTGTHLILMRSKVNPKVRRWQGVTNQATLFHEPHSLSILGEVHAAGGNLSMSKRRAELPEVRKLVEHGLIELETNPARHISEFTAKITKHGRAWWRDWEAHKRERERKIQSVMFKGVVVRLMVKAKQVSLFGGPATVHTHVAKNPGGTGVHVVKEHQRAVQRTEPNPTAHKPAKPKRETKEQLHNRLTQELSEVLRTKTKYVPSRLYNMGWKDTCSRCFGSGHHSFNQMTGTICFKCGGSGETPSEPTPELLEKVKDAVKDGALDRYIERRKLEQEVENKGQASFKRLNQKYADSHTYHLFYDRDSPEHGNMSGLRFALIARVSGRDLQEAESLARSKHLSADDRREILRRIGDYADAQVAYIDEIDEFVRQPHVREQIRAAGEEEDDFKRRYDEAGRPYEMQQEWGHVPKGYATILTQIPPAPTLDVSDLDQKSKEAYKQSRMRKAAEGSATAGLHAPPHAGLVLKPSKTNPRMRRWQQVAAKPSSSHVHYLHPETGEKRVGKVHTGGAQGISVVDEETGKLHRVEHGNYTSHDQKTEEPQKGKDAAGKPRPKAKPEAGKGKPKGKKDAEPEQKAKPVNYRETRPGLANYPPKDATNITEGGEDDDWKLKWKNAQGDTNYGYTTTYVKAKAEERFARMVSFGEKLPEFTTTARSHLGMGGMGREAVLAAMALVVQETLMRAGGTSKDTFGVSTLQRSHVKVDGDRVTFDYLGKSGVPQTKEIEDPEIAAAIQLQLQQGKGDRLWSLEGKGGKPVPATAAMLRDYIGRHTDGGTTKDFRTYSATKKFAEVAAEKGPPESREAAEPMIKEIALEVAKILGHKKQVTRKFFAQAPKGAKARKMAEQHGGRVLSGGKVGFVTSAERRTYMQAVKEASIVPKDKAPKVEAEWRHEPMTSLNNYIDPKVVEAYRQGLTMREGGTLRKAADHDRSDREFMDFLAKVDEHDPYKTKRIPDGTEDAS